MVDAEGSIRTCLACREKNRQKELFRFAMQTLVLNLDSEGLLGGRGAYCCRSRKCLKAFLKNRKGLLRAFRCKELQEVDVDLFLEKLAPAIDAGVKI